VKILILELRREDPKIFILKHLLGVLMFSWGNITCLLYFLVLLFFGTFVIDNFKNTLGVTA